jgi:hypothetical protein
MCDVYVYMWMQMDVYMHLCNVRERIPACYTLSKVFHSLVKVLFREAKKKNPVTLVRGPPVRGRADDFVEGESERPTLILKKI